MNFSPYYMRILFLSAFISLSGFAVAQDKNLLQKQLMEIMLDFPNQYRNLKQPKDSFFLKFRISGTTDDAIFMGSGNGTYISAFLSTPQSDEEAKALFEKWSALISSIDFNGAVLTSKDCEKGKFGVYCRAWKLDNSKNNIDPRYAGYTIKIEVIKIRTSFAAGLKIGNF